MLYTYRWLNDLVNFAEALNEYDRRRKLATSNDLAMWEKVYRWCMAWGGSQNFHERLLKSWFSTDGTLWWFVNVFKSLIISSRDVIINVVITVRECHKGNGLVGEQLSQYINTQLRREKTTLELEMKVDETQTVETHRLSWWRVVTFQPGECGSNWVNLESPGAMNKRPGCVRVCCARVYRGCNPTSGIIS